MPPDEAVRIIFADPATAAAIYPAHPTTEQLEILLRQRSTMARLAWNPYLHNPKLLRRLHRIRAPTLVVWGQEDRLFPLEHARAFQQAIPGAALAVLPGCAHVPPLDRPDEFVRAVTEFLEEG
jgi:pimeloyl-ACP methyl ester carboxylesterase